MLGTRFLQKGTQFHQQHSPKIVRRFVWRVLNLANFFDVQVGRVDAAGRRPVHVPERALLGVQDLPLLLVPLLVHLGLGLRLHEDVLPLPAEHFLEPVQTDEVFD